MENNFFKILSGIFGVALLIAVVALFATSISANMKLNEKNTSISKLSAENQKIKKLTLYRYVFCEKYLFNTLP